MSRDRLSTTYDGAKMEFLDVKEHLDDDGDSSQEQPQQDLQAEPPLSPWSPNADPEGMLSDYSETFQSTGLDGTSDDGLDPSFSIGYNEYDETDVSDYWNWEHDTEQEGEYAGSNSALSSNILAIGAEDLGSFRDVISDTSDSVQEGLNTCGRISQATSGLIESLEESGATQGLARTLDPGLSANESNSQPPSIVISNNASNGAANGSSYNSSKSYNDVDLLTGQTDMKGGAAQCSYNAAASLQPSAHLGSLERFGPNNYELATYDRQPPHIPDPIGNRSEKMAVESMTAFNADADSAAANAANAANNCTDPNLLHVKRPRLSRSRPAFQTPVKKNLKSQHPQKPQRKRPASATVQSNLQVPRYPTPPRSFTGLSTHLHVDDVYTKEDFLPIQPTLSRNSSIEPRTPVSPLSSTSSATSDNINICRQCHKTFGGTPTNQKNSLQRHIRDKHQGKEPLACPVQGCAATFAPGRKDNRLKHVRATHSDYPLPARSTKRKRNPDSLQTASYADGVLLGRVEEKAI